jgi:2-hydroxychromene-2-carboxylate isomerase
MPHNFEKDVRHAMTDPDDTSSIRFYFSFRSPYAWFAAERLESDLGDLKVPIELVPIYPTSGHLLNATSIPEKMAYLVQDVARLARERGLALRFPSPADPDWSLSHAAFLHVHRQAAGAERRFMLEAFRKRWSEGLDLGEDAVIADAARAAGLDPATVVAGAHSSDLRAEVSTSWQRAIERDRIFGVPSFIYAGKLYWGQDRMHFVRNAVMRKSGAKS